MSVMRSIKHIFRRNPHALLAAHLYGLVVERARDPVFYAKLGVPDTADGRFEMIGMHVHLLCRRLVADGEEGGALAQVIFDQMFADVDRNLREMGVGDLAVGKRIKRMAQDYFGRAGAVEAGLQNLAADGELLDGSLGDSLGEALRRNLYGETEVDDRQVETLVQYIQKTSAHLDRQQLGGMPDAAAEMLFGHAPAAVA
jgi:cytochrome b pre-mRNA-processing protein 3